MIHEVPYRVYYEDTDAGGVMYHGAYVNFFARARNEFVRDIQLGLERQQQLGICFIVRQMKIDFYLPAKLDDLVEIRTEVIESSRIMIQFKQQMWRGAADPILLAEAQVNVVSVDLKTFKPKRLTDTLLKEIGL